MRNVGLSKLISVGVVAMLAVVITACDWNGAKDRPSGAPAESETRVRDKWYPARPDIVRAERDAERGRIWALHFDGIDIYDERTESKIRSLRLPEWVWAHEPYACPPDLALAPNGDALVSSNVLAAIWRIDSATFQVTRHELVIDEHDGRDIGFSALAYWAPERAFFAISGLDGSVWRIDPSLTRARRIPLSSPMPAACDVKVKYDATRTGSLAALCVQTELEEWTVHLAPDYRTGYARPAQCSAAEVPVPAYPLSRGARAR